MTKTVTALLMRPDGRNEVAFQPTHVALTLDGIGVSLGAAHADQLRWLRNGFVLFIGVANGEAATWSCCSRHSVALRGPTLMFGIDPARDVRLWPDVAEAITELPLGTGDQMRDNNVVMPGISPDATELRRMTEPLHDIDPGEIERIRADDEIRRLNVSGPVSLSDILNSIRSAGEDAGVPHSIQKVDGSNDWREGLTKRNMPRQGPDSGIGLEIKQRFLKGSNFPTVPAIALDVLIGYVGMLTQAVLDNDLSAEAGAEHLDLVFDLYRTLGELFARNAEKIDKLGSLPWKAADLAAAMIHMAGSDADFKAAFPQ